MSSKNKQFTSKKDKKKMEELGLNEVELPQELNDMVRKMTEGMQNIQLRVHSLEKCLQTVELQ